jgi:hypothetical protein
MENVESFAHIISCVKYLLSLDDVSFRKKYYLLPNNIDFYNVIDCNASGNFCVVTYAVAFIYDTELVHKCLSISKVPLLNSLRILSRRNDVDRRPYIGINMESCKLLISHGCNLLDLLYISRDYDISLYIINLMTEIDLCYVLHIGINLPLKLAMIFIIDKIYTINDEYLKPLLHNNVMSSELNDIIICYYIIRCLTIEDGKKYIALRNKYYGGNAIEQLNNLLEFHFRLRGGHTKCPVTF